jgi:hypothetical protein
MTQEALKELLEAVEEAIQAGDWKVDGACDPDTAISRARKALAQTQEPVAWISPTGHIHFDPYLDSVPLYTTPPQRSESSGKPSAWVGLTDEQLADCMDMSIQKTCRAIEAKLKELNT